MKAQVAKVIPPSLVDTAQFLLKWEHRFSYAGQMFLLADLISDTIARWDTLAYQMSGCPDANNICTWQIEYSAPQTLAPGVPTVIGGSVVNENGPFGIAWPTGAIAPGGWYVDGEFTVEARTLFGGDQANLTTWIRRIDHGGFDFPGNFYPAGYPGQGVKGSYLLKTHNSDEHHPSQYVMYAMSDQYCLTTSLKASWQASELESADWALSPLSCLKDLTTEHVSDPAGRNRPSRYPTIANRWLGENQPLPRRGPPGGKPREKK